jgi:hypothetical protein
MGRGSRGCGHSARTRLNDLARKYEIDLCVSNQLAAFTASEIHALSIISMESI